VEFDGGVVIGADSRTSTGSYVANRVTDKLTRISDKIYCCRSGSAADTQAIADIVSYSTYFTENQNGKDALVSEVAAEFRRFCYGYRDSIVAGIIVAGYDDVLGGQVYSVPLGKLDLSFQSNANLIISFFFLKGGMMIRQSCTIGGSGSSFIYAYMRENFKENMEKEACVEFVKKAVFHAIFHDGSSGGVCRIGVITKDGIERRVFFAPPIDSHSLMTHASTSLTAR
jgi:20S proteasome subunit beta 1